MLQKNTPIILRPLPQNTVVQVICYPTRLCRWIHRCFRRIECWVVGYVGVTQLWCYPMVFFSQSWCYPTVNADLLKNGAVVVMVVGCGLCWCYPMMWLRMRRLLFNPNPPFQHSCHHHHHHHYHHHHHHHHNHHHHHPETPAFNTNPPFQTLLSSSPCWRQTPGWWLSYWYWYWYSWLMMKILMHEPVGR